MFIYTCDLLLEWRNGAILNNFIDDIEYPNYFFYDNINNKVYDFYFRKILQDNFKTEKE